MLLHCNHCNQPEECQLDKATEKVYCTTCNQQTDATPFTVQALKSSKQFYTSNEDLSFAFLCMKCKVKRGAVLLHDDLAVCRFCENKLDLSTMMLYAMKESKRYHKNYQSNKNLERLKSARRSFKTKRVRRKKLLLIKSHPLRLIKKRAANILKQKRQ